MPGLHVGSRPPEGHELARVGFRVLVLCACDHQPPDHHFPGVHVMRLFLRDDGTAPTQAETEQACRVARTIAGMVRRGENVLVTCNHGRNRSALVAALTMTALLGCSGRVACNVVRLKRKSPYGPALSNDKFRQLLSFVGERPRGETRTG